MVKHKLNGHKLLLLCIWCFSFLFLSNQYPQNIPGYYSQHGQDKYLNEIIFKDKKNGFFIEVGAHDGISFSNTYFFEHYLGWQGICIEPIVEIFEQLVNNRICVCENVCLDINSGKKTFLKCSGYITEMYSGIIDHYDPRHMERIDDEISKYGGSKEFIEVNCITFDELIKKYQITYIDFMSIDIEGGEEAIIRSIDFEKISIDVILVENNFNSESIRDYLISKGYQYINRIGKDDLFQYKEFCE